MKLTIFTPTYNRKHTLPRLYASLCKQTCKDFEWIVIDDGSTDETETLFHEWQNNQEFPIFYRKVNNGGKHRAINKGVSLAKGEYFFIVDSDDFLTSDAVCKILDWFKTIKNNQSIVGVVGNKGYSEKKIIGTTFEGDYIDLSYSKREIYGITGDKAEIYYTSILLQYKFPIFEGENFLTERVVWDRIAYDGYKLRYFNDTIYIADYLTDGLTLNAERKFIENPQGYALLINQMIKFYKYSYINKLRTYNSYYDMCKTQYSFNQIKNYLNISYFKLAQSIFAAKIYKKLIRRG